MKRIPKIHKAAKGFYWLTTCGTYAIVKPTKEDIEVTCESCKKIMSGLKAKGK